MPNNIFGNVGGDGLTNPLTEDLLANGFRGLNFTELHTDELHDNTGTGKIIVHEEFNMTNNKITNMADPVAGKDAVTLDYAESNFASQAVVPSTAPYDLYFAVTDESSAITTGLQNVSFIAPRVFTANQVSIYVSATSGSQRTIQLVINGTATGPLLQINPGSTTDLGAINYTFNAFDKIEVNVGGTDLSMRGLKVIILGNVSI
jgi:hypothetical protein